jgi:hypothetical protein
MALFSRAKGAIFRAWKRGIWAQSINLIALMLVEFFVARAREKCRGVIFPATIELT